MSLRLVRAMVAFAALAAALPLGFPSEGAAQVGTTFTVNTTDIVEDGVCDAHCSLPDARDMADAHPGPDTIEFHIPGPGPYTIHLGPPITTALNGLVFREPAVIDAETQSGWSVGHPVVVIDGTDASTELVLDGGYSTVKGLVIHGNFGFAIELERDVVDPVGHNVVQGNFIGVDVTGAHDVPTGGGVTAQAHGECVVCGPMNMIGGTLAAERNVIVPARNPSVLLQSSDNSVQGNFIGTDADGTVRLLPDFNGGGVLLMGDNNHVGGTTGVTPDGPCTGACNVISVSGGLQLSGSGNTVQGNLIGTDVMGTKSLGGGGVSISLLNRPKLSPCNRAVGNRVGGAEPGAGNVVAGTTTVYSVSMISSLESSDPACGPTENRVEGNRIGTDVTGTRTIDAGGKSFGNGAGIADQGAGDVIGGTSGVTPDGPCTGACNVISNNAPGFGVSLGGTPGVPCNCDGNSVQGNFIGTDVTGTRNFGNGSTGISKGGLGSHTLIADNVVSGNGGDGIDLSEGSSQRIVGNRIGTNVAGDAAIPNDRDGINWGLATGVIGGPTNAERNVISGNGAEGIEADAGPGLVRIVNNYVGTDVSGTAKLPNQGNGVQARAGVRLGEPGAGNLISGNGGAGVFVNFGSPTIQANEIGTTAGDAPTLGNTGNGISVNLASDVRIGGVNAGEGNVIAGNGGDGVSVFGTGNAIRRNSIFANGELGIDLGDNGVTLNDPGDGDGGSNMFQNFPIVTGASGTTVAGTLNSQPNQTYRVELFSNPGVEQCDASGNGEGERFLGATQATTDGSGDASFSVTLSSSIPAAAALTATATDSEGNTSEFSLCGTPAPKGTIVVRKQTLPATNPQSFAFTTSYGPGFSLTDGQSNDSGLLAAANYSVSETAVPGWDTTASCDDGSPANNISLSGGETVTCTFTNYNRGTIVVKKQTQPTGAAGTFTFTGDASGSIGGGGTITVPNLSTVGSPTYRSIESDPTPNFDLTSISCDDATSAHPSGGDLASHTAGFRLDPGETVTCTFTNSQRGTVSVRKTVSGSPLSSLLPTNEQSFTFQLRQGASTISAGMLLAQADANIANGGVVNFASKLIAGSTYQLCEIVMPGWRTGLTTPFVLYNPSGDNSTLCSNFSVAPGQAKSIAVDNRPPPGGLARTIGFWKNWASCASSSGNQRPVLDQTLAAAEPAGITIGTLTLHGSTSTPNRSPDCLKAVRLLNKSTVDTGKKMSSDPAFNLAAQLLAADLNVKAGALTCASAISAINDAQALLAAVHFDGVTHDKLTGAQATQANNLATTLDRYNNGLLC